MNHMKKNYTIEAWRIFYTYCVVFAHTWLCSNLNQGPYVFCSAGWAVEFFFILSGFLLMCHCTGTDHTQCLKESVWYTGKRFLRFAPMYYLTLCLILGYRMYLYVTSGMSKQEILQYLHGMWPEWFMLNGVYYYDNQANISSWYISALLLSGLVVYFLASICLKYKKNPAPVLLVLSAAAAWVYYSGKIPTVWVNNFRALYCVAGGAAAWLLYAKLREIQWSKKQRTLLTFVEILCVVSALVFVPWRPIDIATRWVVFAFAGIVILSFLQVTPLMRLLNRPLIGHAGKICLGVYLGHMTVLLKFGWRPPYSLIEHPVASYLLVGVCVTLYGMLLTFILWQIKNIRENLKRKKV